MPDLFNTVNRDLIIALAARYRVPAIYFFRAFVDAGGLISYGGDFAEQYPRGSRLRICKELPAEPEPKS
jgi:putative ABC transport system substrate-binding protein